MRRIVAAILMAALVIGTIPAGRAEAAAKPKISVAKLSLKVGQSKQLKVKNTKRKVSWSSNKKSVAAVSKKGKVTAKKAGKATITAKANWQNGRRFDSEASMSSVEKWVKSLKY